MSDQNARSVIDTAGAIIAEGTREEIAARLEVQLLSLGNGLNAPSPSSVPWGSGQCSVSALC